MDKTVLVYLKQNNHYLMLFRNKKDKDLNHGKWIGIGGHIEKNEDKEAAAIREVKEETNLDVKSLEFHGVIHFIDTEYEEIMYLYSSDNFEGTIKECDEGTLKWLPMDGLYQYPLWDGDRFFLSALKEEKPEIFEMTLIYDHGALKVIK